MSPPIPTHSIQYSTFSCVDFSVYQIYLYPFLESFRKYIMRCVCQHAFPRKENVLLYDHSSIRTRKLTSVP